jgi:hypothetical protein
MNIHLTSRSINRVWAEITENKPIEKINFAMLKNFYESHNKSKNTNVSRRIR